MKAVTEAVKPIGEQTLQNAADIQAIGKAIKTLEEHITGVPLTNELTSRDAVPAGNPIDPALA
jgi:hypothetical protein